MLIHFLFYSVVLGGVVKDTTDFAEGVFFGMRANKDAPSECVQETEGIVRPWSQLEETILQIIEGDVILSFQLATNVNTFLNSVVAIMNSCSLRVLSEKSQELFTRDGLGRAIYNVAFSYNDTATDFEYFVQDLALKKYKSAGTSFGEIISIVLNFYF